MIQIKLKYLIILVLIINLLIPSKALTFEKRIVSPHNLNGLFSSKLTLQAAADDIQEIKALLKKISTYEYGQSRESLSQLVNLMMKAMNNTDVVKQTEKEFLKFLDSDATVAAKHFICERLSFIASDASISRLLKMLGKSSTAEMALYTLDRIPDEEVDKKLIKELDKAEVKLKAGIITSLGRRETQNAVTKISTYVSSPDSILANAAIEALANIGGEKSIQVLANAKNSRQHSARITGAYLRCADKLSKQGDLKQAHTIYTEVFESVLTKQLKYAALQGMVLTSGDRAPEIIKNILTGDQTGLYAIAISLIKYVKPNQNITDIVKTFPTLPQTNQVQLLAALEGRNDPMVKQTMIFALENEDVQVRCAAIKALTSSAEPALVPMLAKIAAKSSGSEQILAREGVVLLNGPGVDDAILEQLPNAETAVKVEYIRALGERKIEKGAPLLFQCLKDENEDCRLEALKALRKVASPQHLEKLLAFHGQAKSDKEREESVNAIVAAAEDQVSTQILLTRIEQTNDIPAQASLIEAMGRIGDTKALPLIRVKLHADDGQLKVSAIRALADWPTAEPIDDLIQIAKKSDSNQHRVLALRGYINLLPLQDNQDEVVDQYLGAMQLAENLPEKRMVLSGLSRMRSSEAVNAIAKYLDDEQLQREAERAIFRVTSSLDEQDMKKAIPVLKKIVATSNNESIKQNAQEILDELTRDQ